MTIISILTIYNTTIIERKIQYRIIKLDLLILHNTYYYSKAFL